MSRGKSERSLAFAMASLAETLARLSMDVTLFLNQNFDFIAFPSHLTTGSSIMPHKKNPDVFELVRAKCNRIKALSNDLLMITTNLPSGYHRDLQILKESIYPGLEDLRQCMEIVTLMLREIQIKKNLMQDPRYLYAFSVEAVNRLVLDGMSFRDAYQKVGSEIEHGNFTQESQKSLCSLHHTHLGSIGNLANDRIRDKLKEGLARFPFQSIQHTLNRLKEGHAET
jgi:argininosuccinate lyase